MERFTIFRSHFESLKCCTPEIRLELYDAMLGYAFDGKEPEFSDSIAKALWIAILPVIKNSIKQAQNGSKPKPRIKPDNIQTESKKNPEEIQPETKSEPNKEVEVEIEKETTSTLKVDYGKVKELWDSICGLSFGKIHKITETRKANIKIRATEFEKSGTDYLVAFEKLFNLMADNDFLRGINNRNWKASFDWIIENDQNYVKVLEGRYGNKINPQNVEQYGSRRLSERATEESFYQKQSQLATAMLLRDGDNGLVGSAQDN